MISVDFGFSQKARSSASDLNFGTDFAFLLITSPLPLG
jgi:hypothetical protein